VELDGGEAVLFTKLGHDVKSAAIDFDLKGVGLALDDLFILLGVVLMLRDGEGEGVVAYTSISWKVDWTLFAAR